MDFSMILRKYELETPRYGKSLGNYKTKVSSIRLLKKYLSNEMLMQGFNIDRPTLEKILNMIEEHPDWSDEDIADKAIG